MPERLIKVMMSESSAKATLEAVANDPDKARWGRDEWKRKDAIIELSEALGIDADHD